MLDHTITKPLSVGIGKLNCMLEELCFSSAYQFVDRGDYFVVRIIKNISTNGRPIKLPEEGAEQIFFLRASVAGRRKKTNRYPASANWRWRVKWLHQQGHKLGFEVIDVYVKLRNMKFQDRSGRDFSIECSDFTGLLRVTNKSKFEDTMQNGICRFGRAFGFGMLIIWFRPLVVSFDILGLVIATWSDSYPIWMMWLSGQIQLFNVAILSCHASFS